MAFFSKEKEKENITPQSTKKQENTKESTTFSGKSTNISKSICIQGNIEGTDTLSIDGEVKGNVTVNHVIIGKYGLVTGSITAQKVVISGKVNGSVTCNDLDIMHTGYVTNKIHAKRVTVSGEVLGDIVAEISINVTPTGSIKTNSLTSQQVMVNGIIEGKVSASELLNVGSNGFVNGEISVKNIKTEEGGRVIGSMALYDPSQASAPKQAEVLDAVIEK